MKPMKKFKDEHVVLFEGEHFQIGEDFYRIFGVTGVDIDNNKIQLRDDLTVLKLGRRKPLKFDDIMMLWSSFEQPLIAIVKKKKIFKRKIKTL